MNKSYDIAQLFPQGRPSLRAVLFREMIAVAVKASGGDIIATGKRNEGKSRSHWKPPKDWHYEKIVLPGGARAEYMVPKDCTHPDRAILYLHGGGYTLGYFPIFQERTDKLAVLGGHVPVFSLDYRVAPEHPYPAALEDARHSVEWLQLEKGIVPGSIIAIGESAGAGLSLALSMWMRDNRAGTLRALVLMSPWVDLTCSGDSYAGRYHMDPMFGRKMPPPAEGMRTYVSQAYASEQNLENPYVSPVFGDFADLPPMLVHVGEYEMLYDDAVTVYKKASAAGTPVELKVWRGMFHAFQLADFFIPEARTAWREIGEYMRRMFGG